MDVHLVFWIYYLIVTGYFRINLPLLSLPGDHYEDLQLLIALFLLHNANKC